MLGRQILGYKWTELAQALGEGDLDAVRLHGDEDKSSMLKACSRSGYKPVSRRVVEPHPLIPGKEVVYYLIEVTREGRGSPMLSVAAGLWGTYGSLSAAVRQLLQGHTVIVPNEEMLAKVAAEMAVWLRSDYRAVYESLGKTRKERRIHLETDTAKGTGGIGLSVRAPARIVDLVRMSDAARAAKGAKGKKPTKKRKHE